MPKSPNPRRDNPRLYREHVGRPRFMAMVPVLIRDPDCLLHRSDVFDLLFPEGRRLNDLDYADLDALCSCQHEVHEPVGGKRQAERKTKTCPRCRTRRAANGSCFCD